MISQDLLDRTFNHYEKNKNCELIVNPSLPILYFGNLPEYRESDQKVITVAKNPSSNEFRLRKTDPFSFCRFPEWDPRARNLQAVLNAYFQKTPLKWFSSYRAVLEPMNSSFESGTGLPNRVLHTDVCTPLATDPTWTGLPWSVREQLADEGFPIWQSLLEELQPDLILVSIPIQHFRSIFVEETTLLIEFSEKKNGAKRKHPYEVLLTHYPMASGKRAKVVFGNPAQTPFGSLSNEQRNEIGRVIHSDVLG